MRVLFEKHRRELIIALTTVLFLINLGNIYFILKIAPQSNDECLWTPKRINEDSLAVFIKFVKKNGVAWNAGIRDGDQLLEINGVPVKRIRDAQFTLNSVPEGDSANYVVARNGKIFHTKVVVKKLISFPSLGFALLAFIWLLVSFIVVLSNPKGEVQKLFYILGVLFTFVAVSSFFWVGYLQNPYFFVKWMIITADLLSLTGSVFLPFALIHFFLIFPRRMKIVNRRSTLKILYGFPILLFAVLFVLRVKYVYLIPVNIFSVPRSLSFFLFGFPQILILLGMIVGLVLLFLNYMKLESKRERAPIFVILVAYTIGVVAIIYTFTLASSLVDTFFNHPEYLMPIIVVSIIPVAFGYSVFRYSLLDVSEVVKNTILYTSATVAIGAVYFLIIYLLGQSISGYLGTDYQGIIAVFIFIVFAIVFQSTKDKFQNLLTKKFYPEQFAYQEIILKFSNEIAEKIGVENILDSTFQTFVKSLNLKRFAILLKEGENFVLKRGAGVTVKNFSLKSELGTVEKAIKEKIRIGILPVIEREEFEKVFPTGFRSLYGEEFYTVVPLLIKTKIVGLLLFGLKHSGARFGGRDLELLSTAAHQVAVALENARLYESEAEKLKIEREIENARRIQESLLPKEIPEIKGAEICGAMFPAMQIGGDYYDLIRVGENQFFVVVADVSGKGLSASFYMSKIQTMMRLYCKAEKSPKEILLKINEETFGAIEKNWFITISLALFDMEKMRMKFCRAGHTSLIKANSTANEIIPRGIAVGLADNKTFASALEEKEIVLAKDNLFCFYSDGVSEAMNPERKIFGVQRIKSVLEESISASACSDIQEKLLSEIESFRGVAEQNDDITLVLVRIKS